LKSSLLQRVLKAHVDIAGVRIADIGPGLLVLVGVRRDDGEQQAERLLERLLGYRVFPDTAGRMNLNVAQAAGGLLLVPQFTLAADTSSGMRPSFTPAANPETGKRLFGYFARRAQEVHQPVACGRFGADMQISLVNDGPVTFWLEVIPPR
jgi:D-tyrosyl-tRNA(Tyr) deacylase